MRRRADKSNGILLAYFINLFFNSEWLLLSIVLFIFVKIFNIPYYFPLITLGIWIIWTAIITIFLSAISSIDSNFNKPTQNKNPYSVSNKNPYSISNKDK